MKKVNMILIAMIAMVLFTSCETANNNGQSIISFGEAFSAQWRLDSIYAILSILFGVALAGYVYYISKYKEWETGTIIIGMILLMGFTGIFFGMPLTTMLNTTVEAAARGNYVL